MNSEQSELGTSNSNRMFFHSNEMRLPSASISPTTYHHNSKTTNAVEVSNSEIKANNDFNSMSTVNGSTTTITTPTTTSGPISSASNKYIEKSQERYVWEMRSRSPNVTPASTVLNSPDLNTDMQSTLQLNRQHHQINVGRSPGSQFEEQNILPQGLTSPGSPTDIGKAGSQCLRDGEIVVFDDIDTNWMNKNNSMHNDDNEISHISLAASQQHQQQHQQKMQRHHHHHHHHNLNHHHHHNHHNNNDDVLKVTKMIGQLPIAEYEGSPRRFGNNQQNNQFEKSTNVSTAANIFPKRPPGFPQRISPKTANEVFDCSSAALPGFPQRISPKTANEVFDCSSAAKQYDNQAQQEQQQPEQHRQSEQERQQDTEHRTLSSAAPIAVGKDKINDNNTPSGNLIDIDDDRCDAMKAKTPAFDYLYEFSETRKVLEEFFKANAEDEKRFTDFTESGDDVGSCDYEHDNKSSDEKHIDRAYVGQRLARIPKDELYLIHRSPKKQPLECDNAYNEANDIELYIDSNSRSSCDLADTELEANLRRHSRNFTLSPETTDYDSNCGDLDSLSNDINCTTDFGKLYTSMPVLEDGLSSGHASDTENNATVVCEKQKYDNDDQSNQKSCIDRLTLDCSHSTTLLEQNNFNSPCIINDNFRENCAHKFGHNNCTDVGSSPIIEERLVTDIIEGNNKTANCIPLSCTIEPPLNTDNGCCNTTTNSMNNSNKLSNDSNYDAIYAATPALNLKQSPPPPPAPVPHRQTRLRQYQEQQQQQEILEQNQHLHDSAADIQEAMKEIRSALHRAKTQPEKLKFCDEVLPPEPDSPIWVLRKNTPANSVSEKQSGNVGEDEEADTDLETDRLLGQQRLDDQSYFDDKAVWPKTSRISGDSNDQSPSTSDVTLLTSNSLSLKPQSFSSATIRQGIGTSLTPNSPENVQIVGNSDVALTSPEKLCYTKSPSGSIKSLKDSVNSDKKAKSRNKEGLLNPAVLIEGVLFRARYLGSTQLVCEGQPTKSTRMLQAEEAVSRIKAPEGESQPSTEVDLFISTEKIMVLNTDLKEIMMDHALRTISYIADIGDLVVLMARRRFVPSEATNSDLPTSSSMLGNSTTELNGNSSKDNNNKENSNGGSNKHSNRTPKMICHVFESDEAQFIAQSIGQAFQVAYMEFLKANGIEDHSFVKEMDYQEVLNSQEIFGDELEIFAKKELQKEVVVPKAKGEILGVVIVESGWGSMLPTVVIANLMSTGAAARCGQLNIGDQLIAINGMSLVGLPLSTCQSYIRNAKNQTAVKFTVVPCPPVVEVKIKRPNTKYQLGFSVQNGVICSLLRGGIAERGGVRVGHRIIEINNQSVVAVPHEKIVNLLATSVGEILMKTMPTSMFRLLTGQENPIYI